MRRVVVTKGDGPAIDRQFTDLYRRLDQLEQKVAGLGGSGVAAPSTPFTPASSALKVGQVGGSTSPVGELTFDAGTGLVVTNTGAQASVSGTLLVVEEVDGAPSVNVKKLVVTNGKLTDDGGGQATLDLSAAGVSLTLEEQDGTPSVANVTTIKVTNGKLTDDGAGVVSLDLSAAGGTLTVEEQDGNPSVASVTTIKVSNGKLTDDGGGTVSIDLASPFSLTVEDADGAPSVANVSTIVFPSDAVTDDGGGQVTITFPTPTPDAWYTKRRVEVAIGPAATTAAWAILVGTAAPGNLGTMTYVEDAYGQWINAAATGGSGSEAGWYAPANTGYQRRWGVSGLWRVTPEPAGIEPTLLIWVGFVSGALGGVDTPTTQSVAAFRYATNVDGTAFWRCVTHDGGATPTVTTTSIAIAAGVPQNLRIELGGSDVRFYINDVLAATHTTALPSATLDLGWICYAKRTYVTRYTAIRASRMAWRY